MKRFLFILIILCICSSITVLAEGVQPTQQFSKIYLSPFYRESMVLNTNYTYTVTVNPPDGVSKIVNAIISLNAQVNGQTQTFTLWVNNKACNNPQYVIATAFSTTGNLQAYFDCSNVITQAGTYTLVLRSAVNTGAITGWLDTTYMNNPQGKMDIFGTEYYENDDATLFLLLKDSSGNIVSNATCILDIYYPNIANQIHPEWINDAMMRYLEEGLYYYDFITPSISGLYMANAQCTYITDHTNYYTLYSINKPIRTGLIGTYTGDTFVLNDYTDWLYTQCDSASGTGGNKVCDAYFDWTVGTNITKLFVNYVGESTGSPIMTFSVWNWSGNAWVILPNTLLFHSTASGVPSGVDEYQSNSIPDLTRTIAANGSVRVRTNTIAGSTFKLYSNWLALDASKYTTNIQDLKGSGEIHVSSLIPSELDQRFYHVLSCDGYLDGRCGISTNDGEFDVPEGEIEDFINITAISSRLSWAIIYNSPFTIDCTALDWIKKYNGTTWNHITNYETYSQPTIENCQIKINQDLVSGQEYAYWIKFDNYMKWEVDYSKNIADNINKTFVDYCSGRNFTYTVPITESTILPTDLITQFCYYAMDDIYYLNYFYDNSLLVTIAGEYVSYVEEMRFYRKELYDRFIYLALNGNTTLLPSQVWTHPMRNLTYYPPTATAANVWDYPIRNLTYYPVISTSNLTAQQVWDYGQRNLTWLPIYANLTAQQVWEYANRNLTSYPYLANLTAKEIWEYVNRNLTYYQMPYIPGYVNLTAADVWAYSTRSLTNYAEVLIADAVWNASARNLTWLPYLANLTAGEVWTYMDRNLTWFPATTTAQGVWNYVDRNLTWFPPYINPATDVWTYMDRNLTYYAYTNPAGDIWTYMDRNLTYYPPTTTAQGVWEYVDRNLTYYPAVSNLTVEDVWNYANRNLTYYEHLAFPYYANLTAQEVWEYGVRNLTYYVIAATSNLTAEDVWQFGYRNLTYTPDVTDYQAIYVGVWNYTNRNLTWFPAYVNPAGDVWTYMDRNLTYYPEVSNLTATDVWVYTDRNLTYYAYVNPANDIWQYANRTITESGDIPRDVWNYTARYTHGEVQ